MQRHVSVLRQQPDETAAAILAIASQFFPGHPCEAEARALSIAWLRETVITCAVSPDRDTVRQLLCLLTLSLHDKTYVDVYTVAQIAAELEGYGLSLYIFTKLLRFTSFELGKHEDLVLRLVKEHLQSDSVVKKEAALDALYELVMISSNYLLDFSLMDMVLRLSSSTRSSLFAMAARVLLEAFRSACGADRSRLVTQIRLLDGKGAVSRAVSRLGEAGWEEDHFAAVGLAEALEVFA